MGRAHHETLSERGWIGCRLFLPFIKKKVQTCGSCRIPSPPPDPTESCHLRYSMSMHFAAITNVMRDQLVLFNLLRRSFQSFPPLAVFVRLGILQASRRQCARRLHMRSNPTCPLKHQSKSAPQHLLSTHPFRQLSRNRKNRKTRSSNSLQSCQTKRLSLDSYPPST